MIKTLECPKCKNLINQFDETVKKGFCPSCDFLISNVDFYQNQYLAQHKSLTNFEDTQINTAMKYAINLFELGENSEKHFQKVIELDPDNQLAHFYIWYDILRENLEVTPVFYNFAKETIRAKKYLIRAFELSNLKNDNSISRLFDLYIDKMLVEFNFFPDFIIDSRYDGYSLNYHLIEILLLMPNVNSKLVNNLEEYKKKAIKDAILSIFKHFLLCYSSQYNRFDMELPIDIIKNYENKYGGLLVEIKSIYNYEKSKLLYDLKELDRIHNNKFYISKSNQLSYKQKKAIIENKLDYFESQLKKYIS